MCDDFHNLAVHTRSNLVHSLTSNKALWLKAWGRLTLQLYKTNGLVRPFQTDFSLLVKETGPTNI